jgi:hypothetical protein
MVMSEMEKPRETFMLGRRDYRNKTDKVTRACPQFYRLSLSAPPNHWSGQMAGFTLTL